MAASDRGGPDRRVSLLPGRRPGHAATRLGPNCQRGLDCRQRGQSERGPLHAAKAGVIGFTKALGKELATSGILVNCITPAVIETDILKQITPQHVEYMRSKIPMGRFGKREEAAALVAWLCSADCSFSTGGVFDLSGGRATY